MKARMPLQMRDALAKVCGTASYYPVDIISFLYQELGKIAAILSGHSGDEGSLHLSFFFY